MCPRLARFPPAAARLAGTASAVVLLVRRLFATTINDGVEARITPSSSPFHQAEQLVQHWAGVREMVEKKGRAVIRKLVPDQHRAFFEALPFLVVSTADWQGQPWASLLFGAPGFVSLPETRADGS